MSRYLYNVYIAAMISGPAGPAAGACGLGLCVCVVTRHADHECCSPATRTGNGQHRAARRSDSELPDIRTDDESSYHTRRSMGSRRSSAQLRRSREQHARGQQLRWSGTQRDATDTTTWVA